ncbi:2985_t:CDS:2 [Ambispora leptoticha]|uniref:2985_t:CDS:1 n=1 Tax=Ambispora leptoticha TaxID=144679 RepID=A0A9N9FJ96_9GLOM|nr:2985_t:CDS:2 [Ambispora leptoticha]
MEEHWKLLGYNNALLLSTYANKKKGNTNRRIEFSRCSDKGIFSYRSVHILFHLPYQMLYQSHETWHRSYEKIIRQPLDQRTHNGHDSKLKSDALNLLLDLKEESVLNKKDNGGDNYRMGEEDIRDSLQILWHLINVSFN